MPRQPGSKVVPCPKCDTKVVAMPGETGTCKSCGTKVRITKKLLADLGKK